MLLGTVTEMRFAPTAIPGNVSVRVNKITHWHGRANGRSEIRVMRSGTSKQKNKPTCAAAEHARGVTRTVATDRGVTSVESYSKRIFCPPRAIQQPEDATQSKPRIHYGYLNGRPPHLSLKSRSVLAAHRLLPNVAVNISRPSSDGRLPSSPVTGPTPSPQGLLCPYRFVVDLGASTAACLPHPVERVFENVCFTVKTNCN